MCLVRCLVNITRIKPHLHIVLHFTPFIAETLEGSNIKMTSLSRLNKVVGFKVAPVLPNIFHLADSGHLDACLTRNIFLAEDIQ